MSREKKFGLVQTSSLNYLIIKRWEWNVSNYFHFFVVVDTTHVNNENSHHEHSSWIHFNPHSPCMNDTNERNQLSNVLIPSLKKLIANCLVAQNFQHSLLSLLFSTSIGLAEAARGRGNSRANYPSVSLIITTNALLLLLITKLVSCGISELTFLSVHSPLITSWQL